MPSLMVSALCWACLVRPWASHPLECGLSSAPGVLVFKPLAFFPSWVLTMKSKAEALDTSDSSDFPIERKHFKAACHCLKCLVEMLRNLEGGFTNHSQAPALPSRPPHSWRRGRLGEEDPCCTGRGSWAPNMSPFVTRVDSLVLNDG